MKLNEMITHVPRVKNRLSSPRYRIYKSNKMGKFRLALSNEIIGNFKSFELAVKAANALAKFTCLSHRKPHCDICRNSTGDIP